MNNYYDDKIYNIEEINIPEYAFILVCSKRRSGKSVLTKNLLQHILNNFEIDLVILFSNTFD